MAFDAAAAVHAPAWTVIDYENEVLAHRISLLDALRLVFDVLVVVNGSGRWSSLFTIASAPVGGDGWRPIDGDLFRIDSPSDKLRARGKTIDVRDLVAAAADTMHAPLHNIDLHTGAYRAMPILFDWPKDQVGSTDELGLAIERYVREQYAADLAAGTPVTVGFDLAWLRHIDELNLWVYRQLFDFHASAPGRYAQPDHVYGFDISPFRDHVVLAWGCMPHAHEMAWGIAYGIDVELPVDPDRPSRRRKLEMRLEPQFVAQIGALLQNSPPGWTAMNDDDVARMLAEKEENQHHEEQRAAILKAAQKRLAAKLKAAKQRANDRKAAKKTATKKSSTKTTSNKTTARKPTEKKTAPAKKIARKITKAPIKKIAKAPAKKITKQTPAT